MHKHPFHAAFQSARHWAAAVLSISLCLFLLTPTQGRAQTNSPAASPLASLQGKSLSGETFRLDSLRGKVVMLMFWSTDCAVCRDKMPELRVNYEGWKNQAFELVLVSTDKRMADIEDYERILSLTLPMTRKITRLWTGETSVEHNLGALGSLPATFIIDKSGKVVQRHNGRIPAQAWDVIAELL